MGKLLVSSFLIIVFMLGSILSAQAETESTEAVRKGKYVFRKCIACHKNNTVAVICPGERSNKFWDAYVFDHFEKCRKVKSANNFDKYKFTSIQITYLMSYVHKFAKDSDNPLVSCH